MANFAYNISKGEIKNYCRLAAANDALILVPLETSGIQADASLMVYTTLSALLAASNNEQTTIGRKTITSVTITVDNVNNRTDVDFADPVWASATGNNISDLVVCYDPDTTAGTDTTVIPLTHHDFSIAPNGTDITGEVTTGGFARFQ